MQARHPELASVLDQAKKLFFLEMDQSTTAYIYGSGATGDWSSARSDLDLLVFIKAGQLLHFKEQLAAWKQLKLPSIDGFLCVEDKSDLAALRLDALFEDRLDTARPLQHRILPPDLWNVQNRSKRLFGNSNSSDQLPKVSQQDLQRWAISNKDEYWVPEIQNGIAVLSTKDPNVRIPLAPAIWVASGVGRIVNLIEGGECISKQEALRLFIRRLPKSETNIQFLIENYDLPDDSKIMTVKQAQEVSSLCLELLRSI